MGNDDDKTSNDKLYLTTADGCRVKWHGLQSISLASEATYDEPDTINLKSIEGTMTFTIEDAHICKQLLRRMRRWERKKLQQKKRKLAKEKKHGILHKEA